MRPNKENMRIWVKIKILEKVQGTELNFFSWYERCFLWFIWNHKLNNIWNRPTIIGISIRTYPERCLQIAHCLANNSALTTNMNNHDEVLLWFSYQQLTNHWETKRIVLLLVAAPSSQNQKREKQPQKIPLNPDKNNPSSWNLRAFVHFLTIMCWFHFVPLVHR